VRINTKVVYDMETCKVIERESYDYPDDAPLALCNKAITGAALLAGAAVLSMVVVPAGAAILPYLVGAELGMASQGVTLEAGAIAEALTQNRGMNITTRQAAGARQIIYGQQRVGGLMVYNSTTGSSHDQMNFIIVLAGHEIDSIENLYLDGRQVHWQGSGDGWSVRNGVGFGGVANSNSYTGPNGVQYNFGGTGHSGLYCEARYGDQPAGDYMNSLQANDPNWGPDSSGNVPSLMGCAYIYLKVEYNTNVFPSAPEIRVTVNGKNTIFDPRTGTTGFTSNAALIAADVITDPVFGLGDNTVNQVQLAAAANVCDEQIMVAALGQTESQYACNYHYDTSTGPGDVVATMMDGMGGRLSRIGGEWFIWPAYWQGPSFTFDENSVYGTPSWSGYRSVRDLINRVNGTYIAPTFPWNVEGNLYDANGFFNGEAQDNFSFAYQATSFPQYACDTLHGFASDQYLNEDGGFQHPKQMAFSTVLSVTQAQRLAKIALLRNRQQGSGTLQMSLAAYQMQPTDVFLMNFGAGLDWNQKQLEVTGVSFSINDGEEGQAQSLGCSVNVIETDISVYEWNPATDERTVYDLPATPTRTPYTPAPPTNVTVTSGYVSQPDGTIQPQLEVSWNTPLDVLTTQIQIQYQLVGASTWMSAGSVDVSVNFAYINGVANEQNYNVQIRSARANGAYSVWAGSSVLMSAPGSSVSYTSVSGLAPVASAGTYSSLTGTPILATTSGAPTGTATVGTTHFDPTANTLYVYNGTGWKSLVLS
jgi:hypothetical protein